MLYVCLPVGSNYGWGVLGKQVVFELAQLADMRLVVPAPEGLPMNVTDEIDWHRIKQLLPRAGDGHYMAGDVWRMPGPVINAAFGGGINPLVPQIEPPYQVGYVPALEENVLSPAIVERTRRLYRHLVAGSSYGAEVLEQHGLTNVSTVLHGVDTIQFHPRSEPRPFLKDQFVIFSGGKFELRKGQDIVIRAYKVLQDRHPDVFLINSWFNMWPGQSDAMQYSKLIDYQPPTNNDYFPWMNGLLAANGLDLNRVLSVGLRDNRLLPALYHATDLGLFPNRVEGGNNMMLMEYMACGKPVIAAYNSGQKDVLRKESAILIERHQRMNVLVSDPEVNTGDANQPTRPQRTTFWSEPDLEETIEKLEWSYQNRDTINQLGKQAAAFMAQFTWKRAAQGLIDCALRGQ